MFASEVPFTLPSSPFITAAARSRHILPVAWCRFDKTAWHNDLHQHWQLPLPASLHNAVVKRKAEHLASRWLAQQMLAQLGMPDFVLRNAADRSPLWPAGIHASLSHAGDSVVIAATREPLCVGIDVEQLMETSTARETADLLMNGSERTRLEAQPLPFAHAATLLFSLKESLYKALWPQIHQPMDFLQAELTAIDMVQGCATLRLTHAFTAEFAQHTQLQARFWLRGQYVITLVTYPCCAP